MRPVTKINLFGLRLAVVALLIYWLALFTGTHLPAALDVSMHLELSDKSKHFGGFFGLGLLMCYITNSPNWFWRFFIIGAIGMAYAVFDELTQQFVPGRYADAYDFLADSAGLWSAIILYVAAKYAYRLYCRPVGSQS